MALSIFNSERRVYLALLTLAVGAVLTALLNVFIARAKFNDPGGEIAEKRFWQKKINSAERYDAVFLGDSRCLNGIDPAFLSQALSISAYNGAFSAGGLNKTIYQHANKQYLKAESTGFRAVILVITPWSMGDSARKNALFHSLQAESAKVSGASETYLSMLFKSVKMQDIKLLFLGNQTRMVMHDNGWQERTNRPRAKSQKRGLKHFRTLLNNIKFTQDNIDELIEQTQQWRKQGVRVFAVYPPSISAMENLEMKELKWDWRDLIRKFEAAGGVFLDVPDRNAYNAYDSIHLNSRDAAKFSKDLTEQIVQYLKKTPQ